jgi:hypothetical protein
MQARAGVVRDVGAWSLPGEFWGPPRTFDLDPWRVTILETHSIASALPVFRQEFSRAGFVSGSHLAAFPDRTAMVLANELRMPAWFALGMLMLFALAPLSTISAHERLRRRLHGKCVYCAQPISSVTCGCCGRVQPQPTHIRRRMIAMSAVVSVFLCGILTTLWLYSYQTHFTLWRFWQNQTRWRLMIASGRLLLDNQPDLDRRRRHAPQQATISNLKQWILDDQRQLAMYSTPAFVAHIAPNDLNRFKAMFSARLAANSAKLASFSGTYVQHSSSMRWPVILAGLPALAWLLARLLRRRLRPGHCAGCGYNLRGNVSGVCPECGRSIDLQKYLKSAQA